MRLRIDDVTARQQGLQVFLDRLPAVKEGGTVRRLRWAYSATRSVVGAFARQGAAHVGEIGLGLPQEGAGEVGVYTTMSLGTPRPVNAL